MKKINTLSKLLMIALISFWIVACGGGSSESEDLTGPTTYEIYTVDDLLWVASRTHFPYHDTYILKANINLNGVEWKGIGDDLASFNGTFDGNNHTISGLKLSNNKQYTGLFGYILGSSEIECAVIKDLKITLQNGTINNNITTHVGTLAGYANNAEINNISISGSKLNVTLSKSNEILYVGGILGQNSNTTKITNSYFITDIDVFRTATSTSLNGIHVGGITAHSNGTIEKCYYKGNISAKSSANYTSANAGGIAGYGSAKISYSTGKVEVEVKSSATAGGIIGSMNGTVETCYSTATINAKGTTAHAGGIAGSSSQLINSCYATGNVVAESTTNGAVVYAGGISGYSINNIQNCAALNASVQAKNTETSSSPANPQAKRIANANRTFSGNVARSDMTVRNNNINVTIDGNDAKITGRDGLGKTYSSMLQAVQQNGLTTLTDGTGWGISNWSYTTGNHPVPKQ